MKASEPDRLVCVRCGFIFYQDPKVAVGHDHPRTSESTSCWCAGRSSPDYGKWVFPGGYVDRGEQVIVAAVREAREEAGLEFRIDRLLNVYSYPGRAPVIIVYVASIDRRHAGHRR